MDILFEPTGNSELLLLSRIIFGSIMAYLGFNHFINVENMTKYAEFKGLPLPKISVLSSGLILVLGGIGILLGVFAAIFSIIIAGFLILSAITMHDFWNVDEEQKQTEKNAFLKNIVMSSGAILFFILARFEWSYALNIGLF